MERTKAEYRSSIRSKRLIREAFLTLMQEKEVSKITVTDIVNKADINRSTFYAHYPDARGVMDEFEDENIQHLMDVLDAFKFESFFHNPTPILLKISRFLEEDLEHYRILISSESSMNFLEKLKKTCIDYMMSDPDIPENVRTSVSFEMRINFFAGGIVNMHRQWLLGNLNGSLNDIALEIGKIICDSST